MKAQRFASLFSAAVLLSLSASASAATLVRYESQPGSKMRIDGTSTIHDWYAESQLIAGSLELDAALIEAPEKAKPGKVAAQAEIFVLVRSFKCSSGKAMDAVMQETMNEKKNPRIVFKLVELTFKEAKGAQLQFEAKGNLTVSGVTKEITFPVTLVRRVDQSRITFNGTTALKMTDFKIPPPAPTAGVGLIKTGDEVKLTFEWVLVKKEAGK